jgi:hypothetical protein
MTDRGGGVVTTMQQQQQSDPVGGGGGGHRARRLSGERNKDGGLDKGDSNTSTSSTREGSVRVSPEETGWIVDHICSDILKHHH